MREAGGSKDASGGPQLDRWVEDLFESEDSSESERPDEGRVEEKQWRRTREAERQLF